MPQFQFVARKRELARLQSFLDQALAGEGQVVFVTGEAGAGKTALVTEFTRRAQETHPDLVVAIGTCNAQTGVGDPYLPFREMLGLLTGDVDTRLAQGRITQDNAERLRGLLRVSGQVLVDLGPDLIDLLVPGVGLATRAGTFLAGKVGWLDRLEEISERKSAGLAGTGLDQNRIFEQYTVVLRALASRQPLTLVLDDLHWADTSSVGLLFHLARSIGDSRILLIGTYRAEDVALGQRGLSTGSGERPSTGSGQQDRHPLESALNELKRHHGDIWVNLGDVGEPEGRAFVDALVDTAPNSLGEDFRAALYRHTDGQPLFTAELLRAMQERGDLVRDARGRWVVGPTLDWRALPARVEGVIEERIGRLEKDMRETLTVASVEGEDFIAEVVARVQEVDERGLVRDLSREVERRHRLVGARGVDRIGQTRLSLYQFRHSLFQRYLYDSLDEVERSYLHEDMGLVLEALYADRAGEVAVQLARHFQAAGLWEKAVEYLVQAGQRAIRLSANGEAIAHLRLGLELLDRLPDSPHRTQQELMLQTNLGLAYIATRGFGAPEVGAAYNRALELCRAIGETPQLFPVLWGLWVFYLVQARLGTARELAEEMLRLGEDTGDPALLLEGHWTLGDTLFWLGEFEAAREHLEQAVALYDPAAHRAHAFIYGQDPGVSALIYLSFSLWFLGYPDEAMARSQESIRLARELEHPFSLAWALGCGAFVRHLRRDVTETLELADATIQVSTEYGHPFWLAAGTMMRGWAQTQQGERLAGIEQIRQGLEIWRATGSVVVEPHWMGVLAYALAQAGDTEDALVLLDDAIALAAQNSEASSEIELHRLWGEVLLQASQENASEADAAFQRARDMARERNARSRELQAAVSLARLWASHGRQAEARAMLAEVVDWFGEGVDSADLREARAVLAA
jgi:predicted ATPase